MIGPEGFNCVKISTAIDSTITRENKLPKKDHSLSQLGTNLNSLTSLKTSDDSEKGKKNSKEDMDKAKKHLKEDSDEEDKDDKKETGCKEN